MQQTLHSFPKPKDVDRLVMIMMAKMVMLIMTFLMKVVELLDELASDPDDKHVPPSVRNSYRCEKVVNSNFLLLCEFLLVVNQILFVQDHLLLKLLL